MLQIQEAGAAFLFQFAEWTGNWGWGQGNTVRS